MSFFSAGKSNMFRMWMYCLSCKFRDVHLEHNVAFILTAFILGLQKCSAISDGTRNIFSFCKNDTFLVVSTLIISYYIVPMESYSNLAMHF